MLSRAFFFVLGICVFQTLEAQVYTDSFEAFSLDINGKEVPDGWKLITGKSQPSSTPGFIAEGMRSLQLSNDTNETGNVMIGRIITGTQLSETPAYFNGYLRLLPMALAFDTCELNAFLTRWNPGTGKRDTIYKATHHDQGFHTSMRSFSVPFVLSGDLDQPDSCFIEIKVTRSAHPRFASTLYTDQISLTKDPAGIAPEKETAGQWHITPGNDGVIVITGPESSQHTSVNIVNIEGKTLLQARFSGNQWNVPPLNNEGWVLFLISNASGTTPVPYFYRR